MTKQLLHFLKEFSKRGVYTGLSQNVNYVGFFEEIENLQKLIEVAVRGDGCVVTADEFEPVRTARQSLLVRKGMFFECLTLFPLGAFIHRCASGAIQAFSRDQGFVADLTACVQAGLLLPMPLPFVFQVAIVRKLGFQRCME